MGTRKTKRGTFSSFFFYYPLVYEYCIQVLVYKYCRAISILLFPSSGQGENRRKPRRVRSMIKQSSTGIIPQMFILASKHRRDLVPPTLCAVLICTRVHIPFIARLFGLDAIFHHDRLMKCCPLKQIKRGLVPLHLFALFLRVPGYTYISSSDCLAWTRFSTIL